MKVEIAVDMRGFVKGNEVLQDFARNPEKYKLYSNLAHLLMVTWWDQTFEKEGARRGHAKWAPLDPKYAAWLVKHQKTLIGGRAKILWRWGHLGGSRRILNRSNRWLDFGTDVPYAPYHQEGTSRLPKREFLFFTDADMREMADFTEVFLERVLHKKFT